MSDSKYSLVRIVTSCPRFFRARPTPTNGCTSPELPSATTNSLIAFALIRRLPQVFPEPGERFAPRGFRRLGVVARAGVVVEGVVDVRIHDLAEGLAVLPHRRLDRRNVLVDAVVAPGVDREHRRADSRDFRVGDRNAVKRHRGTQIGQ